MQFDFSSKIARAGNSIQLLAGTASGKATTKNNRNKPFTSNEIKPNTTFAQALQPKTVQQRALLDGNPDEATTVPRGENVINNNQYQQSEAPNGFTMFDAIKELKTFFQLFPGLMEA
ncbi:hypothetical protein NPIL_390831 [Nephila pilipes]|uniref:Uncharacterized protein n=1 Tax=Nephila pilipes TaxID=299642 RepID=A0A8X6MEM8_NEPPI|nr:hypothetical protein NPIL_390831 [Nephila pilipes]